MRCRRRILSFLRILSVTGTGECTSSSCGAWFSWKVRWADLEEAQDPLCPLCKAPAVLHENSSIPEFVTWTARR